MVRWTLALLLTLLVAPLGTGAPAPGKIPLVGVLFPGAATGLSDPKTVLYGLRQGLQALGYVEGQTIHLEYRFAEWQVDRLPGLAAELVRLRVDVLVALAPAAVHAAKEATATLPIVALDLESDPVASGLVASLARPGGNLTGLFLDFPDFAGKQLELLKAAVPGLTRVAVLWDPKTGPVQVRAVEAAARAWGLQWQLLEVHRHEELPGACRAAADGQAGALLALSSPLVNASRQQLADCALRHRLPAMTLFMGFAEDGGLMSYGPNIPHLYQQTGVLVSKVLRGANPADIPVARPETLALIVNLKTAQALGLTLPPALLFQADQVIR
jgi:putative tryptophan/tyrosine transport system substrate-binding protein